jgi:hypothetical protein
VHYHASTVMRRHPIALCVDTNEATGKIGAVTRKATHNHSAGLLERHFAVLHGCTDRVSHARAHEKLAIACARHGARLVIGVSAGSNQRTAHITRSVDSSQRKSCEDRTAAHTCLRRGRTSCSSFHRCSWQQLSIKPAINRQQHLQRSQQ